MFPEAQSEGGSSLGTRPAVLALVANIGGLGRSSGAGSFRMEKEIQE